MHLGTGEGSLCGDVWQLAIDFIQPRYPQSPLLRFLGGSTMTMGRQDCLQYAWRLLGCSSNRCIAARTGDTGQRDVAREIRNRSRCTFRRPQVL